MLNIYHPYGCHVIMGLTTMMLTKFLQFKMLNIYHLYGCHVIMGLTTMILTCVFPIQDVEYLSSLWMSCHYGPHYHDANHVCFQFKMLNIYHPYGCHVIMGLNTMILTCLFPIQDVG
jgi:hypothetical protein